MGCVLKYTSLIGGSNQNRNYSSLSERIFYSYLKNFNGNISNEYFSYTKWPSLPILFMEVYFKTPKEQLIICNEFTVQEVGFN